MSEAQDEDMDSVLQAILLGMLIPDNSTEAARASLNILSKLVGNALENPSEAKYERVSCGNEKINRHVCNTPGASEFMDAIFFPRVENEFLLVQRTRLKQGQEALKMALASLPPPPPAAATAAPVKTSAPAQNADLEYEQRKRESEARLQQVARKKAEEQRQQEAITQKIRAEQREVQSRPVQASHAVSIQRPSASATAGRVVYTNTDREFQQMLSGNKFVLANFTASWCGPCQQIAPQVEEMARANTHVQFIKIDIDENQETPGKFDVRAVPTFILFKNGTSLGEVKGANAAGVQALLQKAV